MDNYHWHSGKDFFETDHLDVKKDEQKMRSIQRGYATRTKFIESLLADGVIKQKAVAQLDSKETRDKKERLAKQALAGEKSSSKEQHSTSSNRNNNNKPNKPNKGKHGKNQVAQQRIESEQKKKAAQEIQDAKQQFKNVKTEVKRRV
jgi:hypothetical protein